jgi:hypothetical protein
MRLRALGLDPLASTGADTRALIKATADRWRDVIKASDIRGN